MQLTVRDMTLNLSHPQVMGILNVTPDSFSDGGRHNTEPGAAARACADFGRCHDDRHRR